MHIYFVSPFSLNASLHKACKSDSSSLSLCTVQWVQYITSSSPATAGVCVHGANCLNAGRSVRRVAERGRTVCESWNLNILYMKKMQIFCTVDVETDVAFSNQSIIFSFRSKWAYFTIITSQMYERILRGAFWLVTTQPHPLPSSKICLPYPTKSELN